MLKMDVTLWVNIASNNNQTVNDYLQDNSHKAFLWFIVIFPCLNIIHIINIIF